MSGGRKMLVIDTAYTHRIMTERGLIDLVTSRDLDGYFAHVWACHPFATLFAKGSDSDRHGPPQSYRLADAHTLIEGRVGRYRWLSMLPPLNFIVSQIGLVNMLVRLVRREGIDLVRCEDALYNGLFGLLVARLTGRPLVIGIWGNPGEIRRATGRPLMGRLFRSVAVEERVERFVLPRADLALAQNEDNRSFIVATGVQHERTAVFRLGNSLNPIHFSEPATRGDGHADLAAIGLAGKHVLLVISRLEPLKLVDHVILALGEMQARGVPPVVLFAGDGRFRHEMEALAERLCVENQVRFLGNRSQDWFARVLPVVSAVISPLTGRALAEAALGGAPVVAYDTDWHSELVTTGETGELVGHRDYAAMARAVERLLDDPARARRMGTALRAKAMAMLDPALGRSLQAATYDKLLQER